MGRTGADKVQLAREGDEAAGEDGTGVPARRDGLGVSGSIVASVAGSEGRESSLAGSGRSLLGIICSVYGIHDPNESRLVINHDL